MKINEEIEESNNKTYSYSKKEGDLIISYIFMTEDNDKYVVRFFNLYNIQQRERIKGHYNIEFIVSDIIDEEEGKIIRGDKRVINKGRFYKVMTTIIKIIQEFVNDYSPEQLNISPSQSKEKDKRRFNIYKRYIEKLLPDTYQYKKTLFGNNLVIKKKKTKVVESFDSFVSKNRNNDIHKY